ncbi:MAG: hypothetical protein NVS1B14_04930 [Vulcanimicrobiaceae bacterium]
MIRWRNGAVLALLGALATPAVCAPDAARTALDRYLRALERADYASAYAMLPAPARAYYKERANFSSVFVASGARLEAYRVASRTGPPGAVDFTVEERVRVGTAAKTLASITYRVALERGTYRVDDRAHPMRAVAIHVAAERNGASVTARRIDFFPRQIAIALTFTNRAPGFVTFLPYNKTVLIDDRGGVYRAIQTKDWRQTDRSFFLGVRLAQNAQLSGTMHFAAPAGARPSRLQLEIAPVLRERGRVAPFSIPLPPIRVVP